MGCSFVVFTSAIFAQAVNEAIGLPLVLSAMGWCLLIGPSPHIGEGPRRLEALSAFSPIITADRQQEKKVSAASA